MDNNQNNNNNTPKKKWYFSWWFISIMVFFLSIIGALAYNQIMGGSDGINSRIAQRNVNKRIRDADGQTADMNFRLDSMETIRNKLKSQFGDNFGNIDANKTDKYLTKEYGEKGNLLIGNGFIVSADMKPKDVNNARIEIATVVEKDKYVGLPQKLVIADYREGTYTAKSNKYNFGAAYVASDSSWFKVDNHDVSSPAIIVDTISSYGTKTQKDRDQITTPSKYAPIIMFVKAGKDDTLQSILDIAKSITVKEKRAGQLDLAFSSTTDDINTNQQKLKAMSAVINIGANSKANLEQKVFPYSLVPIMFQIDAREYLAKDGKPEAIPNLTLNVNGKDYNMTFYKNSVAPNVSLNN